MKEARGELLRFLGEQEGERISGAVRLVDIPHTRLQLLGELASEGLVLTDGVSVQFSHDMVGDWSRYRSLVMEGRQVGEKLKERVTLPRWRRPINLYAQRLAERDNTLREWKATLSKIESGGAEAQVVSDLFLDSLIFASNSEALLAQVWPDLIADGGQTLRRLLKRVMYVLTVPDWRLKAVLAPKDAETAAILFRIPQPLYWMSLLRVLVQHRSDLTKLALFPSAEICGLWLRIMPQGMPGRIEAATIAVDLAKEVQGLHAEEVIFAEDSDKTVYEALLYSAPEFPEDVSRLALELSGRRDESSDVIERAIAANEEALKRREEYDRNHPESRQRRRFVSPHFHSEGPLRPPSVDGPSRRVTSGFTAAVLDTPALGALVAVRPAVAREVLLAICIEEPRSIDLRRTPPLALDALGLAHWKNGYPPFYSKGPFYSFLKIAPAEGIDAIVRLVNQATVRWLENAVGPDASEMERRRYGLDLTLGGAAVHWTGDPNVFGWHRTASMGAESVECSLMALEKWLYDEIEEGRKVTNWIQFIFDHGKSLAFAGVLIAVGLRHHALFTKELQGLLGHMALYDCQMNWAANEPLTGDLLGWNKQNDAIAKMVTEWHNLPHRRLLLQDVAPLLMLRDPGTLEYLTERRTSWAKGLENVTKDRDRLEFFIARFDPQNYIETKGPNGEVFVRLQWPAHLQEKVREFQQSSEINQLCLTIPRFVRECLSNDKRVKLEFLPTLASQIRRLADDLSNLRATSLGQYAVDAIAGGIALLVVQNREWLTQNPEIEGWCFETMRVLGTTESTERYSPYSICNTAAEAFLAEAAVALLPEIRVEWVQKLAFEGVTGFYYGSTLLVMLALYRVSE